MANKPRVSNTAKRKATKRRTHEPGTVPRTYAHAKSLGLKRSKIGYNDLPSDLKSRFVQMSNIGARSGSICGIAPSPNQGKMLICYKNDAGRCNWVEVDQGAPPAAHG
jgi:hypothetical protein